MADRYKKFVEWFVAYAAAPVPKSLIEKAEDKRVSIRDAIELGHSAALLVVTAKVMADTKPEVAEAAYERGRRDERRRCVAKIKHWFGGDSIDDHGYECVREIEMAEAEPRG
jgi:hypothetical protein